MKWIKRTVSEIKSRRSTRDGSIVVECRPLVVVRHDGEVLFSGDASIEVQPKKDGDVAKIVEPQSTAPQILVRQSKQTRASTEPGGIRAGQVFYGDDADGIHYAWRIDGAGERFLLKPWPQKWPRFW